jgi:hypothetical protein
MLLQFFATASVCCFLVGNLCLPAFQQPKPQSTFHPPNAFLEFRCPSYALPSDEAVSLTGEVVLPKPFYGPEAGESISYRWNVEGGSLIAGQGSPRITIRPDKSRTSAVRVTLEPKNAPPEIEINKTCVIRLDVTCKVRKVLEYSAIEPTEEFQRLDKLVTDWLLRDQTSFVYLVAYGGKKSCILEAEWRLRRLRAYLAKRHNIDQNRIVTVDGGFRNQFAVAIFVSPSKDCGPLPKPDVLRNDTEIAGRCEEKYR